MLAQAAGFAWLAAHGRALLALALLVAGAILAADGLPGLIRGR
jgi:hypothetical protein